MRCDIGFILIPRLLPSFLLHTVQRTGREPGQFYHVRDDVLCIVLCVVWVIKLLPTHIVLEHLTMLETELPCQLSQRLMPLKVTGGSSSEATTNNVSHFQDS